MAALTEYRALFEDVSILPALILPALILGIPGVVFVLYYFRRRRRARKVAIAAARLGFQFRPGYDPRARERLPQFAPLQMRFARNGYNTASGVVTALGRPAEACFGDFVHVHRGLQKPNDPAVSPSHFGSYFAVKLPLPGVPDLSLRRHTPDDPAGSPLITRIEFESIEFNGLYTVRCDRKRFAFDLVDPLMMQFLLDHPAPAVTIEGGWLMVEGPARSRRWRPAEFEGYMNWTLAFLGRWPEHRVAEFAGLAAGALPGPPRYL